MHKLRVCTKDDRTKIRRFDALPYYHPLRKHAYSIYWKFYHQKMKNFQVKNPNIFHISAQNIDCWYSLEPPRRGGSNEDSQSLF